jgi:hypothetical protein
MIKLGKLWANSKMLYGKKLLNKVREMIRYARILSKLKLKELKLDKTLILLKDPQEEFMLTIMKGNQQEDMSQCSMPHKSTVLQLLQREQPLQKNLVRKGTTSKLQQFTLDKKIM